MPAVTTVVPVTKEHSKSNPGRLPGILAYNDWIRDVADKEQIPCLDLEKALRVSASDRSLHPELTSGDGLHLNKKAYERLDELLEDTVSSLSE